MKITVDMAKTEFQARDDGRWDWERIDYGLTGKDADLEAGGERGIEVSGVVGGDLLLIAHGLYTCVGNDVSLNLPLEVENDEDGRLSAPMYEAYLDQMEALVMGSSSNGEWDGEDWIMTATETFKSPIVFDGFGVDWDATVNLAVENAEQALNEWREEMEYLDKQGNILAGWSNADGSKCFPYVPGPGAAWK